MLAFGVLNPDIVIVAPTPADKEELKTIVITAGDVPAIVIELATVEVQVVEQENAPVRVMTTVPPLGTVTVGVNCTVKPVTTTFLKKSDVPI
jgi:hypothetical protein